MTPSSRSTGSLDSNTDLALVAMDGVRLVLPQTAIRSLEPVLDIESGDGDGAMAGSLFFEGRPWPVYCLGEDFRALRRIPEARRVCVVLTLTEGYLGLLSDGVTMLKRERAEVSPVPACMRSGHSPLLGLAVLEQGLGCVSSVDSLAAYLQALNRKDSGDTGVDTADPGLERRPG